MPDRKNAKSTPKPSRPLTRTERVTQRLMDAATQLFMEKGYDTTSMTEIAARAHASKETIYRHFPNKDDLFRAAVVRRAEVMSEELEPALMTVALPKKALTVFGELVLRRLTSKDSINFHRVLGMARERFPEVLEVYRKTGPFRLRDAVARYIQQQVDAGNLRPVDPHVAARQFFDLVAAEMIINANLSGKGSPTDAVIRQRVKEAVDCFLHGYSN
jgi:TetR/AcrR family transcriptional repressor of mexJK operon